MSGTPEASQIITEMRAAINRLASRKTGWIEVKPCWFKDQDQMLNYMVAKGKKAIALLEARIAEIEGGAA